MHQGTKSVCQPYHIYPGRDVLTRQPVGIASAVPPLMVVTADIADGGKCFALPQLRHPLQQIAALGGMGLHHLKFFLGQRIGLVENLRGDGPLINIMEQGQGGVQPDLQCGQGRDNSSGGADPQQAVGQVLELYAVGCMVNEQLLPAQDGKGLFHIHSHITS